MTHIWKWDWSPTKARAFIVDELGFLVAGPLLSLKHAKRLVAEHNRIVAQLRQEVEHLS